MKVLNNKVLVLNKYWNPVRIITVKKALLMIFSTKEAKIIEPNQSIDYSWEEWSKLEIKEDEEVIRSSKNQFKIPEIIMLPHCTIHCFSYTPKVSKNNIFKRDKYT